MAIVLVAETVVVYVFVTVFLINESVAVCEEVVDAVVVIVDVLEINGDPECVEDAVCVFEIEDEADTVVVFTIVSVIKGDRDPEILVVDVLETELEPERVVELLCVFDIIELTESVGLCVFDLDARELSVYDGVPVVDDDIVGVSVGAGIDVRVVVEVIVTELHADRLEVAEILTDTGTVFDILDVTEEDAVPVSVLETRMEAVTVGDGNRGVNVIRVEYDIVGHAVDVLLGLEVCVKFDDDVDDPVIVGHAEDDFVPIEDRVFVGLVVPVLEDVTVFDIVDEPVIVLEVVIEAVRVAEVFIVRVI